MAHSMSYCARPDHDYSERVVLLAVILSVLTMEPVRVWFEWNYSYYGSNKSVASVVSS